MNMIAKWGALTLPLLWLTAPACANAVEAKSVNTAYAEGAATGLSPLTPREYLKCAATWDRWAYFVASSNVPDFNRDLSSELSAKNARKQSRSLRKRAKKMAGEWDDQSLLGKWSAEGETAADKIYAAFMNDEIGAEQAFPKFLGTCK